MKDEIVYSFSSHLLIDRYPGGNDFRFSLILIGGTMGSLKDLQNYFDWSYVQVRKRVLWLQDYFSSEVKGGQNRKYQVTDSGFAYLERLYQLEQSNTDLSSAQNQLLEEQSPQGKAKLGDKVDIEP